MCRIRRVRCGSSPAPRCGTDDAPAGSNLPRNQVPRIRMENRLHILVVRLSALGDVLFTLPAVRALRRTYPDAVIDWVVEDKAATLLEGESCVDNVIVYPRRALARALRSPAAFVAALKALATHVTLLRRQAYHVVLDFQGNLKSALHTVAARGRRKAGFGRGLSKEASFLALSEVVRPHLDSPHRIDKAMALATVLGPPRPPCYPLFTSAPPSVRWRA